MVFASRDEQINEQPGTFLSFSLLSGLSMSVRKKVGIGFSPTGWGLPLKATPYHKRK